MEGFSKKTTDEKSADELAEKIQEFNQVLAQLIDQIEVEKLLYQLKSPRSGQNN